jgi:hypothetical protein
MVSNTGSRSVGEVLMMPRTWEVAFSRSTASLSSRVSSAVFFLSSVREVGAIALRRGSFTVLRRFVFWRLIRLIGT